MIKLLGKIKLIFWGGLIFLIYLIFLFKYNRIFHPYLNRNNSKINKKSAKHKILIFD